MDYKKLNKKSLLWVPAAGAAILLFYKCPIKLITKIPCPGCGMTRAAFNFFKLNFKESFSFHPLFPLVLAGFIYWLLPDKLHFSKKVENVFLIVGLVLILAVWVFRLINGSLFQL